MSTAPSSADAPAVPNEFAALGLPEPLLRALKAVGYESPSPIQAATIPPLLGGRDLLGQAQTGTGKTAAFALPVLARIDLRGGPPQALVLAPTRELAIQVAEAMQKYAAYLPGFHVLPIYGGQSYGPQLAGLKRGAQVVVGTPGRVIDHLERGSLDLSQLKFLVLDEADEMLNMGFIDDVEKVLAKTPAERQVALFSATMPPPIKRIADRYLKDPEQIAIKARTATAERVNQRYWAVSGLHKLDALTRILETEKFDGMIVFSRTKQGTEELAEKLSARGFAAAAINGDVEQKQRERTIARLKEGQIDILVATDVAARGLDVERISHVVNYDIPYDPEAYVHRIGRTGRAGRSGEAILFVTPRERGMLRSIERVTRQPITPMQLPSVDDVNNSRVDRFMKKITDTLGAGGLDQFQQVIERYEREHNVPALEIAAALAALAQGRSKLFLEKNAEVREFVPTPDRGVRPDRAPRREAGERPARFERPARAERFESRGAEPADRPAMEKRFNRHEPVDDSSDAPRSAQHGPDAKARRSPARERAPEQGMETFRIEVGHNHQVKPGNIVGAIANEAGLESRFIGRIEIYEQHSLIDLPEGMPDDVLAHLQTVWVAGQRLRIRRDDGTAPAPIAAARTPRKPFKPGAGKSFKSAEAKPFKPGGHKPFKPAKSKPPRG